MARINVPDKSKRVSTGIPGLDRMLSGGIPEGNQVILAGGPGTGKTLTSFEFLYKSARNGANCLFISLEEKADSIVGNAKKAFADFDDIDEVMASKRLGIVTESISAYTTSADVNETRHAFSRLVSEVASYIRASKAKIVVIDSISVLRTLIRDPLEYRMLAISMGSVLKDLGVTSILTSELEVFEPSRLLLPTEYFIFDGLIALYATIGTGKRIHSLEVLKMRGTEHSFTAVPYRIKATGIEMLTIGQ